MEAQVETSVGESTLHKERPPLTRGGRSRVRRDSAEGSMPEGDQSTDFTSSPISDGSLVVLMPQASMIFSFAWAVSSPPEIKAPA